ncbi:MAG: hypothetical protein J7603_05380 [Pseudacidovorax sp.]|nr:hypothetical protein [Pseudacidovorax sp.]
MIYVVEQPEAGEPHAWFAYDDEDLARKIAATDTLQPWEIHDVLTARELLQAHGHDEPGDTARATLPAICGLGDEHGWDTPLYRADHLLGRGVLQSQPVTKRDALAAAIAARGGQPCIYWSDTEAVAAFEGHDPRLAGDARWWARRALYRQLVELEVLADDN